MEFCYSDSTKMDIQGDIWATNCDPIPNPAGAILLVSVTKWWSRRLINTLILIIIIIIMYLI